MSIGTIPYQAFPSIGNAITMSQNGKASLPVSPTSLIYSQFRHVSGVPAPDGVQGVTINRLAIIDTLIEQITRMNRQPVLLSDAGGENSLNSMINQYQSQVRNIQAAQAGNPYAPAAPLLGAVFNVRA